MQELNVYSNIDSPIISVIIPIRITSIRRDIFKRLSYCYSEETNNIEYIVVDDGSSVFDARLLEQRCVELGYKYISTNTSKDMMFNLARARNKGATEAQGKYILFLDVDLLTYPGFYYDIITEVELQDIKHNSDVFLMFPVIYFNYQGMQIYLEQKDYLKKHFASQIMIEGKDHLIEKYSYGTSAILVDRLYYLTIGGQNEDFEGWGFEDYDFTIKMMKLSSKFFTPSNYSSMSGNFMSITRYSGWKAEYRLYGMWMARKGIYLYHVPHEIDSDYKGNQEENLRLLEESLNLNYVNEYIQTIQPNSNKSLLLSKNPFCCDYKLNPLLGNYEILDMKSISDWEEIKSYYTNNNFTQVVFPNPYGNNVLLGFYQYCRSHNVRYMVCERGALPGSSYHDINGFLCDSTSYNVDKWDIPLQKEQEMKIKAYLHCLGEGDEALEKQPKRLNKDVMFSELDINNKNKKKILIILQTKNDTVIKFFGRKFTTQESFKNFIEKIISISGSEYEFIYKNHPLEPSFITIDGAINADSYHIHDLINICDAVLTINSGAGLIAALLQKPVFTFGDSWYSISGIACNVNDERDFISKINSFKPSEEKLLRFAYYLRYRFYSFGKHHTVVHKKKDLIINATLRIDYTEVQIPDYHRIFYRNKEDKIGFNSILFKEYEQKLLLSDSGFKKESFFKRKKYKKIYKVIDKFISFIR